MTSSARRSPDARAAPRPGARPPASVLRRVRLVVLDVDGVLTDGRLWIGPGGEEWKSFHVHDGLAITRALRAGLPVAVISSRSSLAVARRCDDLGVREVHQGVADKVVVYEALRARLGCPASDVAAMGDDLADLPVLARVGLPLAPADAPLEVRRAARWVTGRPGGVGAVREAIEAILRAQGRWHP
jgi:3-deoxy-D-manno-octulosonate 8-phosphate phosphatase (KDO 8-P phosphatase)